MQAFPANSKNNTIGGSGPVNQKLDMDRIRGVGPEGYEDFAHIGPNATAEGFQAQSGHKLSFEKEANTLSDPYAKTELQHGEESLGLGTSTFLEGAPAPKSAMQRRESDNETSTYANGAGAANGGGLGRKKSLVQRIRGMSQPKREYQYGAGAVNSPTSPDSPPRKGSVSGTVRPVYPASAGGRITQVGDTSPFFNEYDDAFEKKGASIRVAEQESGTSKELPTQRRREPSSPRRGPALERRTTGDGGEEGFTFTRPVLNDGRGPPPSMNGVAAVNAAIQNGTAPGGGGGGFLNRVKSLKGRNKAKAQA